LNTCVGVYEVAIVGSLQQTFEPGAKSDDELISTWYLAAPATGVQENCGSKTSLAGLRSLTCGVVVDGQSHENEATGDATPRLPSASTGMMFQ
jgi:hypothetical protein